jgi:hypothetical protein
MIAPILARRSVAGFWLAVVLTGVGTGLAAAVLTGLLELMQRLMWRGSGIDLLQAASRAAPSRCCCCARQLQCCASAAARLAACLRRR